MLRKILICGLYVVVIILCIVSIAGLGLLMESKQFVAEQMESNETAVVDTSPFPVSVDPETKTIADEDLLGNHNYESLALERKETDTWRSRIFAFFSSKEWYQNLASPVARIIVVWPGERKEEIADNVGDILRWSEVERTEFISIITDSEPVMLDGKFYPGQYVAHRDATPTEVASLLTEKFQTDIVTRYTPEVAEKVPLADALIIASLLEREASDFENMREISGVIWNRLFINMPLQLDATLQYARGNTARNWWPAVKPADKYIKSEYNTYANKGLPPAPIANPSAASVLAALNPVPTDCLFYFHDDQRDYFCSATYEEHVRKLKAKYGRGS